MARFAVLTSVLPVTFVLLSCETRAQFVHLADSFESESIVADEDSGATAQFATMLPAQPPAIAPRSRAPASRLPSARTPRRPTYVRLASLPKMFGDSLVTHHVNLTIGGTLQLDADFPIGSGAAYRVCNRNSAAVGSRGEVFFYYDHFHHAIEADALGITSGQFGLDQYTIGFEKVIVPGVSSVIVRLPLFSEFTFGDFGNNEINFGSIGNLVVIPKRVIRETEHSVVTIGCGCSFPTGSDVDGIAAAQAFHVENEAYHLLPFIALLWAPEESSYYVHAWLQGDLAANGNHVDPALGPIGKLTEQHYLIADLAVGRTFRDAPDAFLSRVAAQVEFHWASTLNDADLVQFTAPGILESFGSTTNRRDVVNMTAGLVVQLADTWDLGVAGVFPLVNDTNRFFDGELKAHVIRKF